MWILQSTDHVSTTMCLHHLDSNETLGEKAICKLLKNTTYCLTLIQEAAPYKTAAVQPLISYLTNHLIKTNKRCRTLPGKQGRTLSHGHTYEDRPTKNYIYKLCGDTGCSLEDLPREMADRDWWQERIKGIRDISTTWG